jgi:hypothetical protein
MALAYVPGERARKGHANPSGRDIFHSRTGAFTGSIRRIQKIG